jgi:integrase
MARIRSPRLEYSKPRLALPKRKRPYWVRISRGCKLGYRRNDVAGTWTVKVSGKLAGGREWIKVFATADDHEAPDGIRILSYRQAVDRALALARPDQVVEGQHALVSVAMAIDLYEHDLRTRGARVANASVVRGKLPAALAGKCVALLTAVELQAWRDGLLASGLKPATVNRTRTMLRAALNLAANRDSRISNRSAWKIGLRGLPDAEEARRLVLPDADILRIVVAAYEVSEALGLLIELLAQTGARASQLLRLVVSDLQPDWAEGPRVLVPASLKGGPGGRKRVAKTPIPITPELATALKAAAAGQASDAPLLLDDSGKPWRRAGHRLPFREAVGRAGFDPDQIVPYCCRHSSIVRQLKRGVPVALCAKLHDTSDKMIANFYGAYIAEHADALARAALLSPAARGADTVVRLPRRK